MFQAVNAKFYQFQGRCNVANLLLRLRLRGLNHRELNALIFVPLHKNAREINNSNERR